jgi:spermidine/putrescine transport system substrate-binding protein
VGSITRREFIRRAAVFGAAAPAAASLLAACRAAAPPVRIPLASPSHPVTLPILDSAPLIPDGLAVERNATLEVFEWREYLSKDVLRSFTKRYASAGVDVHTTSFENRDAAAAALARPGARFDVFFPTVDQLPSLVSQGLLRPLNHSYLPDLPNLWPYFRGSGPFYDSGQRYTVPYTVYSSGVGWRADLVPSKLAVGNGNPTRVFWDPAFSGRVGVYDLYREAMGLALQRNGSGPNTSDPSALAGATGSLTEAVKRTGLKLTSDGAYEGLPKGEFWAHQSWSGDILAAPRWGNRPAAVIAPLLRYDWPSGGTVGTDLLAIAARGKNPILAHAFLNHLLDVGVAMFNFAWNGYQPPLGEAAPRAFSMKGFDWNRSLPPNLRNAWLSPEEFVSAPMLLPLSPADDARWIADWQGFLAGSPSAVEEPTGSS